MKGKILTIIVPVYNMQEHLRQCLNSLENQTLKAHKVIIVDDGSTDDSAEIAKTYVQRLPDMFSYIYKKNGGLGQARNFGLREVDTQYVAFLDSDDWYSPSFVENIVAKIESQTILPDIIVTLPICFDNVTKIYFDWMDKQLMDDVFANDEVVTRLSLDGRLNYLEPNICRNVLKMKFANSIGLKFPEGIKWEDVLPRFEIVHYAKTVVACKEAHFFYRMNREGQITGMKDGARYEVVDVFRSAFASAKEQSFSDGELNYLIHMFINMALWSKDVSFGQVREKFIELAHSLFLEIGNKRIEKYISEMNPPHRFKRFATLMCSKHLYRIFLSSQTEEKTTALFKKAKKILGVK